MTTAQVGYEPVYRWGQAHPRPDAHHRRRDGRLGGAGPCLAGRARGLRPVAPAAGTALVVRAAPGPDHDQPSADPPGSYTAGSGPARGGSAGYDPARRLGSLDGGHCRGGPHAAHWLGRPPVPLAQRAVPVDALEASPAAPERFSVRDPLEPGRGSRLSKCGAVCPTAASGHRLQRAAALARLGDSSGRLCDGGGALGSRTVSRRAADCRRHGPWAARAAPGAGLGRRERCRCGPAEAQAKPWHGA